MYFSAKGFAGKDKNELNEITDWEKYENIVEINNEGIYTIYAKVISSNERVTYLNTDLIMFDLTSLVKAI